MPIFSWNTISNMATGWSVGYRLNKSRRKEDATRQGRSHALTSYLQMKQVDVAFNQSIRLFKAYHLKPSSSTRWRLIAMGVPFVIGWISNREIKNLQLRRIVNFAQDHVGNVCLMITLVSTVGLLAIGQTTLATASLIHLGIGVLERHRVLPIACREFLYKAGFVVSNLSGLLFEDKLTKMICLMDSIGMLAEKFFKTYTRQISPVQRHIIPVDSCLSLPLLKQINAETQFKVHREHVHYAILPFILPETRLDQIIKFSENFPWKNHTNILRAKLGKDERWKEVGRGISNLTEIEYVQRNIKLFIESIKNRSILQGEPNSYETLESYCRLIAQEIDKQDEITQADMLMQLGIEGGDYCGAGKFRVVEEIYCQLIAQAEGLTLQQHILAVLQQKRMSIWQSLYQYALKINPIAQFVFTYLFPANEVHNYHLFTNFTGISHEFGIPHQAAINDKTARFSPVEQYIAHQFILKPMQGNLWQGKSINLNYFKANKNLQNRDKWKPWKWYRSKAKEVHPTKYDANCVLETVSQAIGTSQIPKYAIYQWWQEWIQKQPISLEEKNELLNELEMDASIKGEPIENEKGKIQIKFLKAMLVEMKILTSV